MASDNGVLIIYTGGTIGSVPRDANDPLSPLVPAPIEEVLSRLRGYDAETKQLMLRLAAVRMGTYSFEHPVDSSNIGPADWVHLCNVLIANMDSYEGFVIVHGTDTLAYTASALSFMLENLSKPVIVTGAQLPIGRPRSDAEQNIITSVEIAASRSLGKKVVPEVCVFFRDKLMRGCRTTKTNATGYDAFDSPNLKPLAVAGDQILFDETIIRPPGNGPCHALTKIEPKVASIDIFPGIQPGFLRRLLASPELKGVVLNTFGTGNAPSAREFLTPIGEAVEAGTVIVNATQCLKGEVQPGLYEGSAGLLARGVAGGMDMTPEAALTKLFVVLGQEPDPAVATDWMQLNLRGEQRLSVYHLHYPAGGFDDGEDRKVLRPLREMAGGESYSPKTVREALLRLTGLRVPGDSEPAIRFRVLIDNRAAGDCVAGGDAMAVLPITGELSPLTQITIVNLTGQPFHWRRCHIAITAE